MRSVSRSCSWAVLAHRAQGAIRGWGVLWLGRGVVGAGLDNNWVETVVRVSQGNVDCKHTHVLISLTKIPINLYRNQFFKCHLCWNGVV